MRVLLDNQAAAVEKLKRLKVGALFMGCGTGKTQTAAALINSITDSDFVLWVAPLRTLDNLKEELALCGCKTPIVFYGVESIGQSDRIFLEVLNKVKAAKNVIAIVDESLKIKNLRAKRTKRLMEIGKFCKYRLILNGTPITKNILDIYPQMTFLSPKILDKNFYKFRDDYCVYRRKVVMGHTKQIRITGYANVKHLLGLIEPYVYECSLDLPLAKHYRTKYWTQTDEEEAAYGTLKSRLLQEASMKENFNILGLLQQLQHSYCLDEEKIQALNGEVTDKTIIYCKFIKSQEFLQEKYPQAKVLTYGKGSFGLNLQSYNKIIYFDKTFDYAFREQAEARIYRTGQQNDCEYLDITGDMGLEGMIDRCIEKKLDLVQAFKLNQFKLKDL